jgi:hypothetical protein
MPGRRDRPDKLDLDALRRKSRAIQAAVDAIRHVTYYGDDGSAAAYGHH